MENNWVALREKVPNVLSHSCRSLFWHDTDFSKKNKKTKKKSKKSMSYQKKDGQCKILLVWHPLFQKKKIKQFQKKLSQKKKKKNSKKSMLYQKKGGHGPFWYDNDSGHWGPFCLPQPIRGWMLNCALVE